MTVAPAHALSNSATVKPINLSLVLVESISAPFCAKPHVINNTATLLSRTLAALGSPPASQGGHHRQG
jgi:hypothetical protein